MDLNPYVNPFAGDPNGYGDGYDTDEPDDDMCERCGKGREDHTIWGRVWNGDYKQYHAMLWEK